MPKPSKLILVFLSLFLGTTGSQRFYLGRNNEGWVILLTAWLLLPLVIFAAKYYSITNWYALLQISIALGILFHIAEAIKYGIASIEKIQEQNKSLGNTWLLTSLSIIIGFVFLYAACNLITSDKNIGIYKGNVAMYINATQLSDEFANNEKSYIDKYENKIIKVSGIIDITGFDMDANKSFIEMQAGSKDQFRKVKCFFSDEFEAAAQNLQQGNKLTVIGLCKGLTLRNCIISEKQDIK